MKNSTTQNSKLRALAIQIRQELIAVRPLGIVKFDMYFESEKITGDSVVFLGMGIDGETRLEIEYILPSDPRAHDAFNCRIVRGDKIMFIADYLEHFGHSARFLSNTGREKRELFVVSVVRKLSELNMQIDLRSALAGGAIVEVPFDYGNAR